MVWALGFRLPVETQLLVFGYQRMVRVFISGNNDFFFNLPSIIKCSLVHKFKSFSGVWYRPNTAGTLTNCVIADVQGFHSAKPG